MVQVIVIEYCELHLELLGGELPGALGHGDRGEDGGRERERVARATRARTQRRRLEREQLRALPERDLLLLHWRLRLRWTCARGTCTTYFLWASILYCL